MKEKIAYAIWACLYILCVGLAFIDPPQGFGKYILILIELIFFLPGLWLLVEGIKGNHRKMLLRLRIVSICSLALTMIFMAATFLTVTSPAGETVAQLLIMVSAPMFCSEYWVLSWFLWACLLMGTLCKPNKKREEN
jgi:hypothetical protein